MTAQKNTAALHNLVYCGAHYKHCPVEMRELWTKALTYLPTPKHIIPYFQDTNSEKTLEIVTLSTCNRFDICILGEVDDQHMLEGFFKLAQFAAQHDSVSAAHLNSIAATPFKIASFLRWARGHEAVKLLFRIAASLDSLVLGEPHILGQIKDSFFSAQKNGLTAKSLLPLFSRSFQAAKRTRTETDLGKNGISIGHAAVEVTKRLFSNLESKKALVVGAGEMGKIVAQHLVACDVGSLTIANRNMERANILVQQINTQNNTLTKKVEVLEKALALHTLEKFDIVVIATAAQHFLIKPEHVQHFPKMRGGEPSVIVDISVPRNVDPDIAIIDNIFAFDVDDLDKIMESNREARYVAAQEAEKIVECEVQDFLRNHKQRSDLTQVGRLHAWIQHIVELELSKRNRHDVENISKQNALIAAAIAKKIISPVAKAARTYENWNESTPDDSNKGIGAALESLFAINSQKAKR